MFYLTLHFIIPVIYYCFYDFVNLYSDINYDVNALKGILLNAVSVIGTIIVIQFLPDKKIPFAPKFNNSFKFYLVCIFLYVVFLIITGGYEDVLSGSKNGTLISYLLLFFDATVSLAVFLYLQRNIKFVYIVIFIYIVLYTISGSRSAIITVLAISLALPLFQNNVLIRKRLKKIILTFLLISPLMFYYATNVRGQIDGTILTDIIVGRISMVELSAIPINAKENRYMDEKLYDAKYGIINQFKQSINEISPLDPFEHDVNPNQYHRIIFLGHKDSIIDKYMSINLTLPTYFYLESNFFFGCILSILFLSGLYYVWIKKSNNIYFLIGIIINLYTILQYFDWVMIVASLFKIVLTIYTLKKFEIILNVKKISI